MHRMYAFLAAPAAPRCVQAGTALSLVPSHHNHAIGEKIGIKLEADHVVAFAQPVP